jgi:hypothetical protein
MKISPHPSYLVSLRPKYSLQHPVLKPAGFVQGDFKIKILMHSTTRCHTWITSSKTLFQNNVPIGHCELKARFSFQQLQQAYWPENVILWQSNGYSMNVKGIWKLHHPYVSVSTNEMIRIGRDQQYALIVPLLYFTCWLLHVSAVACHHQGAY